MRRHWQYLKYVVRHKWFVFLACLDLGVPIWHAVLHDWTKFTPGEWFPYARTFYETNGQKRYFPTDAFAAAWNSHQKRNKHHWQHHMITWDKGHTECLRMPDKYIREMVADWRGAGRALGKPDIVAWYVSNRDNIQLHPDTRKLVEYYLHYNP